MNERLAEAGAGDVRALALRRLAEQHLDASYRLAYAILQDGADAEDATQDAFVTAWRRWPTLRDPDRAQAWFDRILINTCRHRLRARSRHPVRDLSPELYLAAPDQQTATAERDRIADGIAELGYEDRVVLALRYERDLTVDQIARQLGIRAGTVKSRLHYALRRLRDRLERSDRGEVSR